MVAPLIRRPSSVRMLMLVPFIVGSAGAPAIAQSTDYPAKSIRLINPFPAGGTGDVVARVVFDKVGAALGVPVIVEARTGAAGVVGTEFVARAPADGSTLIIGTASTFGALSSTRKNLSYDAIRDFEPVVMMAKLPYLLLVHPSVPAKSLPEFIAHAKANPGKMNYSSFGSGSSNHLAYELLRHMTGIDLVHIPYRGGAPAILALMAGDVQSSLDLYTTSFQHIQEGKMKVLGVASRQRSSLLPDVPTLAEQGVPLDAGTFLAVLGPAGLPAPVVNRLNAEVNKALKMPDVQKRLAAAGTEIVGGTPQELSADIKTEVEKWAKLVRERGLTFD
jgi:tripartite-type tricarboxylate transporter receptor subunit TctC